jgi:hypothetical protein
MSLGVTCLLPKRQRFGGQGVHREVRSEGLAEKRPKLKQSKFSFAMIKKMPNSHINYQKI